jgi:hypothetical protein
MEETAELEVLAFMASHDGLTRRFILAAPESW